MKHLCIFCGSRTNSDEHVWPDWLAKIIKQLPGETKSLWAIRTNDEGHVDRWERATPDLVTKTVCKVRCNAGWMSDLEKDAKPLLSPMINGEEITLTRQQQGIIAIWMIKTAMVLDSMSPKKHMFYEQKERSHFRETFLPPGFLTFWLGHYSGSRWSGFTSHRILLNERSVPQSRSNIVTMGFGRLVLQFANTKLSPMTDNLAVKLPIRNGKYSVIEFGPHLSHSIRWPPPGTSFDDSECDLQTFSIRFGGY